MAFPHRLERHAMKAAAAKRKGLSAVTWQKGNKRDLWVV